MLNSIKSIGFDTAVGIAAGSALGATFGSIVAPDTCCFMGIIHGRRPTQFYECLIELPLVSTFIFGVAGGTIGLIIGVSKQIFNQE